MLLLDCHVSNLVIQKKKLQIPVQKPDGGKAQVEFYSYYKYKCEYLQEHIVTMNYEVRIKSRLRSTNFQNVYRNHPKFGIFHLLR